MKSKIARCFICFNILISFQKGLFFFCILTVLLMNSNFATLKINICCVDVRSSAQNAI